jgi:pyroglutamyl-peptidase
VVINRVFTGFAPFLNHKKNPSWEVAQELARIFAPEAQAIELPVVFGESFEYLNQKLFRRKTFPDQLWLFGLAADRKDICLERVALNWIETDYQDEKGQRVVTPQAIDNSCPDAILLKNHPLIDAKDAKEQLERIDNTDNRMVRLKVSHSAGTYVCNELYFRTLKAYPQYQNRIVFIHLPPESVMSVADQVELLTQWIKRVSR